MDSDDEAMEGHVTDEPRIVLFGMNGQVGSRLMAALTDAGYEVTGIDRARCDFASVMANEVAKIIRAVEPQLVINAAAYTAVDKAESEPELAQRINAQLPEYIAIACQEQHVPCLHFSTDYVFDGLRGAPYGEDAEPHPIGVYAQTKYAGEQAVRKAGGHVFRLQWVFDSRGKNFLLTIRKLLAEKPELRIVADQIGSPSNALHIARAVTQAVPEIIGNKIPAGVYHLTAAGHTSWHGFACAIAQGAMRVLPLTTAEYPVAAVRPKDARLNCSKLASYGISMPHWREGLNDCLKELDANS